MEEWALAVVAGIVLLYIALQTWRPWVLAPAIAFTGRGCLSARRGWAGSKCRRMRAR